MNDLAANINNLRFRIKSELLVNDLIAKGISYEDIILRFKSRHKQNWSNDILHCEVKGGKVYIDLARDGLFDSLPEYLFLKPVGDHGKRPEEKQRIMAFNAQQRIKANILLNPIEHAIFEKRVVLEKIENEITNQLSSSNLEPLMDFYKLDSRIDLPSRVKLVKIYPVLYSVTGDFPLTTTLLSYLLDVPVRFEVREVQKQLESVGAPTTEGLGNAACGDSMIMLGPQYESVSTISFEIGPVSGSEVGKYLPGGEKSILLSYFSNYSIPLEYETEFVVDIDDQDAGFSLDNSFLGFNSSSN